MLIAVAELAAAAQKLEADHGLTALEGGRHRGLGTANRIVPLGDAYLELVAVADATEATGSFFGRWVGSGEIPRLLGWCVRTHELDAVAERLSLGIEAGSRTRPDGTEVRWRMSGLEEASNEPSLPFFIEWGQGTPYPGSAPVEHRAGEATIEELRLEGDPHRIQRWLGGARLPIAVSEGPPALRSLLLSGEAGQIVLDYSR